MLTAQRRRGFTLIELTLSTVTMLLVSGAVYRLLTTTQRLARAQTEQLNVQANVRGAALALVNELRELNAVEGGTAGENDLMSIAPNAITYRAMRGLGFICQPPTVTQIRISRQTFSGHRSPQAARDSAYVFLDGGSEPGALDTWLPLAITGVSAAAACPGSAAPSLTLTVPPTAALLEVPAGTPVRIYEIMELRLYRSDDQPWLGMRSVSAGESIQPLFGPLSEADGLSLDYLDAAGMPTSSVTRVRSIRVNLRGLSAGISTAGAWNGSQVQEQLTTQVALRNALR